MSQQLVVYLAIGVVVVGTAGVWFLTMFRPRHEGLKWWMRDDWMERIMIVAGAFFILSFVAALLVSATSGHFAWPATSGVLVGALMIAAANRRLTARRRTVQEDARNPK